MTKPLANSLIRTWSRLMARQGEQDHACGAYCIVAAATHLGQLENDGDGIRQVLKRLKPTVAQQIADGLVTSGCHAQNIRLFANAAGLRVWRPKNLVLEDLGERRGRDPGIWMARLRMRFEDPRHVLDAYDALHYLLVLEVRERRVVVADPHPWHERVHAMSVGSFCRAWDLARGVNSPRWAAYLYRASR